MVATANAVRYTGATLKLVDAEPLHGNVAPDRVAAAITPRTKAIVVVHIYGHPAAMDRLCEIAERNGIALIEDAAEAHGAPFEGRRVGGFGAAGTFSFYANKIITTGEGGMVTTNDPRLHALVRKLRICLIQDRHFWHEYVGFNYRMTNLQAAVGLAQVERFDDLLATRKRLRALYDERLAAVPGVMVVGEDEQSQSVLWMYAIRLDPAFGWTRDELRRQLARRGIETRTFFIPLHWQPIYFDQFRDERFPVSEMLCEAGLYCRPTRR